MRKIFLISQLIIILYSNRGCDSPKTKSFSPEIFEVSSEEVKHEYSEISKFRISWNETYSQELDDYYVYYFSRTCSHCQEIKNFMITKALEREDIFFVESSSDDVIKNNVDSTLYSSSAEFLAILGYPSLVEIKDKILVKNVAGIDKILATFK